MQILFVQNMENNNYADNCFQWSYSISTNDKLLINDPVIFGCDVFLYDCETTISISQNEIHSY